MGDRFHNKNFAKTLSNKTLKNLLEGNITYTKVICDHINAEQTELNTKDHTGDKIRALVWLSNIHEIIFKRNHKAEHN
jgi:hypothetical protein